jgi:hypothetical protein
MVTSGCLDQTTYPIHPKIKACECISKQDIINRYQRIDELFDRVKIDKRIKPKTEITSGNHREYGGILVHIDRNGQSIECRKNTL